MKKDANEALNEFVKKEQQKIAERKKTSAIHEEKSRKRIAADILHKKVDEIGPVEEWLALEKEIYSINCLDKLAQQLKNGDTHINIDQFNLPELRMKFAELLSASGGRIVCRHVLKEMDEQGVTCCAICREILM